MKQLEEENKALEVSVFKATIINVYNKYII